jgi:phosphate starvation-inducible PhoH-like protein
MRGRTLDHAVIILDEAQNTTNNQMKMFITRLGFNSKMIITGDLSQVDLQKGLTSGLLEATKILKGIKGIDHLHFNKFDVMRHPLVTKVIEKYEEVENDSL